jgi:predicted DNA-binding antitoxin AbrB/MazE fold protein
MMRVGTCWPLCYLFAMRSVEARYEEGTLKLTQPLALIPGERVRVIVVRQPDPQRWDLARLKASATSEDVALAEAGLADWTQTIDSDGKGSG